MKRAAELAKCIDHTLLKPDATKAQILRLCEEAEQFGFASVCVNSRWAETAARQLKGTGVAVCCVAGFPLGAMTTAAKAFEAKCCFEAGAQEVDMVLDLAAARDHDWDAVRRDIAAVNAVKNGGILKVILETCLLTEDEKRMACLCAVEAGADFVKTSTGFSSGGATIADVRLMRETVGNRCRVKAAGGIRTLETALAMLEAGADRLGASAGVAIVTAAKEAEK